MVRSALLISAPTNQDQQFANLVATPQQYDTFKHALKDPKIGGFGRMYCHKGKDVQTAKEAITDFFTQRERMEVLVMYMTGYELIDRQGSLYFTDVNSNINDLENTAIPVEEMKEVIESSQAERKMLIIDSYSSQPLSQDERDQIQTQLATFSRNSKVISLISQDTIHTIKGNDGVVNPGFTESLLKGLETGQADLDQRGYITEEETFLYVYKEMSQYGTAPNLYFNLPLDPHRVKLARNIQLSSLPTYANEDDSLNMARYLRLLKLRRQANNQQEKDTIENVIDSQPETTFLRRLARAAIVVCLFSLMGAWITGVSILSAFAIAVVILIGLLADDFLRRNFS